MKINFFKSSRPAAIFLQKVTVAGFEAMGISSGCKLSNRKSGDWALNEMTKPVGSLPWLGNEEGFSDVDALKQPLL